MHSHIFPTSKAPSRTPPTPIRREKAQAKKTPSKVDPSASTPSIQDNLEEASNPRDSDRTPIVSPPRGPSGIRLSLPLPIMGLFST